MPSTCESLDAIVLAGGRSHRMGRDKALLEFEGKCLLQRICEVARSCSRQVYVVTPWGDRYAHLSLPAQMVPEPVASEVPNGPLSGFAVGLRSVHSEWVLLLACDLPYVNAGGLQGGLDRLPQLSPNVMALLRRGPKGWDPLCGFYRKGSLFSLERAIAKGTRSFQAWLDTCVVAVWENADPRIFVNCNTPEDWKAAGDCLQSQGQFEGGTA